MSDADIGPIDILDYRKRVNRDLLRSTLDPDGDADRIILKLLEQQ